MQRALSHSRTRRGAHCTERSQQPAPSRSPAASSCASCKPAALPCRPDPARRADPRRRERSLEVSGGLPGRERGGVARFHSPLRPSWSRSWTPEQTPPLSCPGLSPENISGYTFPGHRCFPARQKVCRKVKELSLLTLSARFLTLAEEVGRPFSHGPPNPRRSAERGWGGQPGCPRS